MSFPVVESDTANGTTGGAATNGDTAATSHTVTLPATISAGALLIIVGRVAVAGTVAVTGGGWTITQDSSDASDDVSFWMYRNTLAVGNEAGTTITITHGNGKMCCGAMSITGVADPSTNPPTTSTVAVGTGSNPGPTANSPPGAAKDYLWIAVAMADGEHTSPPTTIPANYGASSGWSTGTAGAVGNNCTTYTATRNLNTSSEDPGTWTTSVAVNSGWTSWVITIHPKATRLYLPNAAEPIYFAPAIDSGWEDFISPLVRSVTRTSGTNNTLSSVGFLDSNDTDKDICFRQYISYPLTAGQTITGAQALRGQISCSEAVATNNMFLAIGVRIIAADGSTVQKTVLAVTRDNVEVATGGNNTNRQFTATSAATNYTTVDGDRIVIEIGMGGDPDAASDHDSSMVLGDEAGFGDLAEDDADQTGRPWFEFTDVLTFIPHIVEDVLPCPQVGQRWPDQTQVTVYS